MKIIYDLEQGTEEWLKARLGKITASKFKTVLAKGRGNTRSKTRDDYMMQLAAERLTGEYEDQFKSKHMEWGNEWEDSARASFEIANNVITEEVGFIEHDTKLIGVSPDGLIGSDSMLEIKCPKTTTQLNWFLKGELPPEHKAQVQGQLWIAERERSYFVSYDPRINGKAGYFEFKVNRDEEYIKILEKECDIFLDELNHLMERLK